MERGNAGADETGVRTDVLELLMCSRVGYCNFFLLDPRRGMRRIQYVRHLITGENTFTTRVDVSLVLFYKPCFQCACSPQCKVKCMFVLNDKFSHFHMI